MKKYDKYKKSGIQWVGQIPEHWNVTKIKNIFSFARGLNIKKTDLVASGVPVISYGQIHSKMNTGTCVNEVLVRYVPSSFTEQKESCKTRIGDFIFADTSEDKEGCGNCVYIDKEGIFAGYHSIILNGDNRDNKYLAYLFKSSEWRSQIRSQVKGVKVYSITQSILSESTVLIPSSDEQRDIAVYLDDKTGKIDKATEAINKQIDDLRAYRQSLISETVTKGLNPDAPMKDSGIQWIGQIPKHWDCVKLRYLVATPLLYGASESGESDKPSFPRYIRITDITENGKLRNSGAKYLNPTIAKRYMLEPGDILFARSGATVGKTFLFTESYPACFAGYLIKVSCGEKLLPSFLYNFTKSGEYQNWVNSISTQATIQNIGADKYSDLIIPLLSPDEQEAISAFLDRKTAKIDEAIKDLEAQRDDLALLKQSLISEAVTGKVDVRGWNSNNETRN